MKEDRDFTKYFGPLKIYLTRNARYRHCLIDFGHKDGGKWYVTAALPYLFYLNIRIKTPFDLKKDRQVSLSFHSGGIYWHIWRDWMDGWSRDIPKWRDGSFDLRDFFLGKSKCITEVLEERDVSVPMPERPYAANAKLMLYKWVRPRWFTKEMTRVEIKVPEGIPHEGKGENSYDCGVDRTYGMTTGECGSIPNGVGILVGSVLSSRVKYGGWSDWIWNK